MRAIEIAEEAAKFGKPLSKKATTIALEEIMEGRVKYRLKKM